jgi:hypothetical protein
LITGIFDKRGQYEQLSICKSLITGILVKRGQSEQLSMCKPLIIGILVKRGQFEQMSDRNPFKFSPSHILHIGSTIDRVSDSQ